jgi:hypothetical protein
MKHTCEYCGGHTHDDDRGNCSACGAPRTTPPDILEGYTLERAFEKAFATFNPYSSWITRTAMDIPWTDRINPWNINGSNT